MKRGVGQRLLKFSFVIIVLLPMVTGCWGKREVEQLGFVIAMGVDAGEKPGRYKITYQIAMPQNGTDGGELKDWTMTVEGSSIRQSEEHVYEVLNKQPFVGSTKVIVIGEGAAKEGINKVLDFFQRFYEFRRTAYLFLGKGTAEEILNTKRKTGSIPGLNILAQMEQNEAVSTVPSFRLGHFLTVNATPGYDAMLPVLEILEPGEHEMEYKGNMKQVALHTSGVFRGDELAGYLTEQETKGTLWINGEVEQQFISTEEHEDKKIFCAGKVTGSSSNYKLVDSEGRLGIDLKVQATIAINELRGGQAADLASEMDLVIANAKQEFEKVILKESQAALDKSRKLKVDFLGLGRRIERKKPRLWSELKDEWPEQIAEIPVNIEVQVTISHFGTSFNPPTSQ